MSDEITVGDFESGFAAEVAASKGESGEAATTTNAEQTQQAEQQTTPEGGNVAERVQAAANGAKPAAKADAAANNTDWRNTPLTPEQLAAYPGCRTLGDLDNKYRSSSRIAREQAERIRQLEAYEQKIKQFEASQQQQRPPDFYGYKDPAEFNAQFLKDPRGAMGKLLVEALKDPQTFGPVIQQHMQQTLAPMQEREAAARFESMKSDAFTRNPEFAPNTPGHEAARNFAEQNPEIADALRTVRANHPGVNVTEILGKLANYEILKAQTAAASAQTKQRQQRAVAARPSTGAKVAAKAGDFAQGILSDATEHGVDQDTANALIRQANRTIFR